jgi:hypothetical protein
LLAPAVASGLVLVWAVLAYLGSQPTDEHEYRRTAAQAAEVALSSVRTVVLAGDAALRGRTPDPYLSTVADDAVGSIAVAPQDAALPLVRGTRPPLRSCVLWLHSPPRM